MSLSDSNGETCLRIRETSAGDLASLLGIHREAFGQEAEAALVREILADPSAQPILSLVAEQTGRLLGHVLFSRAGLDAAGRDIAAALLAPLAVLPAAQGKGIGRRLVEAGLARLARSGVELVFVLGDPRYYGRFGFLPAAPQGFTAPQALPDAYREAWMVKALGSALTAIRPGRVACCAALDKPELWRE